jgi:hypothetical protein
MSKGRFLVILSFLVIWTVLTLLAVTRGTRFDWPDYVHIDYGLPLVWTTHTLNTITGPVNIWEVNISALLMDLTFWLGIMVIATSIMLYFFNRKLSNGEKE